MPSIAEVRQQFPQYQDLSDDQLAEALHRKFYADMPREEFNAKMGLAAPVPGVTGNDLADSGLTGLRQGLESTAGMFGDAAQMGGDLAGWAAEKFGVSPETASSIGKRMSPFGFTRLGSDIAASVAGQIGLSPETQQTLSRQGNLPTTADIQRGTSAVVGEHYQPQTVGGEYMRTMGQFAPAAMAGPGGIVRKAATAAIPAVATETAGQVAREVSPENEGLVRGATALASGVAAPSIVGRAISPMRISPERQAMGQVLKKEGVDLTAGQRTGSERLRYMESELGGMSGQNFMERQGEQFTNAAMQRAGGSGRATPDNMLALENRLSSGFQNVAGRNSVRADQNMVNDFNGTMQEYMRVLPSEQQKIVKNIAQDLVDEFKKGGGSIAGADYQKWRSRLTKRVKNTSDNDLREAWRGLRNALDDAMERSVRPEDAAEWKKLRKQWGNMKVLQESASRAGENAAMGLISPSALRNAAIAGRRGQYTKGQGDFDELARAGEALMKPLPQSGTAPRTAARNIANTVPAAVGALAGSPFGFLGTVAGAAGGAAVPFALGRAIMSRPGRAYLSNQLSGAPLTMAERMLPLPLLLQASQAPVRNSGPR